MINKIKKNVLVKFFVHAGLILILGYSVANNFFLKSEVKENKIARAKSEEIVMKLEQQISDIDKKNAKNKAIQKSQEKQKKVILSLKNDLKKLKKNKKSLENKMEKLKVSLKTNSKKSSKGACGSCSSSKKKSRKAVHSKENAKRGSGNKENNKGNNKKNNKDNNANEIQESKSELKIDKVLRKKFSYRKAVSKANNLNLIRNDKLSENTSQISKYIKDKILSLNLKISKEYQNIDNKKAEALALKHACYSEGNDNGQMCISFKKSEEMLKFLERKVAFMEARKGSLEKR